MLQLLTVNQIKFGQMRWSEARVGRLLFVCETHIGCISSSAIGFLVVKRRYCHINVAAVVGCRTGVLLGGLTREVPIKLEGHMLRLQFVAIHDPSCSFVVFGSVNAAKNRFVEGATCTRPHLLSSLLLLMVAVPLTLHVGAEVLIEDGMLVS